MRDSTLKYKEQYQKRVANYNSRGMAEEPKPKAIGFPPQILLIHCTIGWRPVALD